MIELTPFQRFNELKKNIKVGKSQFNSFGKYNYRTLADIYVAVNAIACDYDVVTNISTTVTVTESRVYVNATATAYDALTGEEIISSTGSARETLVKKGMDEAQITGAATSYASKYAMSALLGLDDTEDIDSKDNAKLNADTKREQEKIAMAKVRKDVIDFLKTFEESALMFCKNGFKALQPSQTLDDLSNTAISQINARRAEFKTKAETEYKKQSEGE